MASTSKEDNARVERDRKAHQAAHTVGTYYVDGGKIRDYGPKGQERSYQSVADDAKRAASNAKSNLSAVKYAPNAAAAANKKLQQDAETARDAIRMAAKQRKRR